MTDFNNNGSSNNNTTILTVPISGKPSLHSLAIPTSRLVINNDDDDDAIVFTLKS